ncbi:MAG TPA: bifunctional riboflavin kinase/FAD synthetase [Blastocatellia bacterium]|jgi:riboflavin kinase/FMN adenylyltransferase|nr:bifunctional riboflavin kinase/FAD synthetase [Blastocatellia bacterium]
MRIFRDLEDAKIDTPSIVTFGVFDGLHLAHQEIMSKVVERSRATGLASTVVTFDPHPRAVLHSETAPPLLQTFEQKMEGMERLGIDQAVVLTFNHDFARMSASDFLTEIIFGRLDAREVYLGHGFAFGHNREGRFELLEQVASRLSRVAEEVPEVVIRNRRASSTLIRRLLSAGRVNLARRMLGRPYGIESKVIEGRKVARDQLNYATANLKPHNFVIPANGVYVTLTLIEGEWRRSITNIGHKPTFGGEPDITVETHVMDFDKEIYGEKIRVRFLHRLRGEERFESVDALRTQIERDYKRALRYFSMGPVRRACDFK